MEEKHKVETINISYKCQKCDKGYMVVSGLIKYIENADPNILYQHCCTKCKYEEYHEKRYPYREEVFIEIPEQLVFTSCKTGKSYCGYDGKDIPVKINKGIDLDSSKPIIDLDSSKTVNGLDSSAFYKSSNAISTDSTVRDEPKEGYPLFHKLQ